MLPGGSGFAPPILAHLEGPGTTTFPPASRVSISELLAGDDYRCWMDSMVRTS
jgi:hypothetical protein